MKIDPKLHHYCQNITWGSLDLVVEMYNLLKFKVVYTPPSKDWIMVGQDELRFAIQITQVDDKPVEDIDNKRKTHIAFLSDNPQGFIDEVESWAKKIILNLDKVAGLQLNAILIYLMCL